MPPASPSTQSAAVQASGCDATGTLAFGRESRPVRPPLPAQLDYASSDSSEGFDGESFHDGPGRLGAVKRP